MRIGIDVGGTNTDAVLLDGRKVQGWVKSPTTRDVSSGITNALNALLAQTRVSPGMISAVMLGTTHFTNAVVERKAQPHRVVRSVCPRLLPFRHLLAGPATCARRLAGRISGS
jgi:N-methylhydantoinase A/oxoprolinase/acetone carboxylase beta subunit